jgi:DNA gyrase/topoisomerase IV subunit A
VNTNEIGKKLLPHLDLNQFPESMKSAESIRRRIEMEERTEVRSEVPSGTTPIKVSDDSNSSEILVFTSLCNVYKVQKKEVIDKFHALQKIDLEPGEKAIYLTGEKRYKGFLIVAFENGKIGKITMDSFQTEYARKKLRNAFNSESRLVFIELIEQDVDLVTLSSIKKVVLFNTSLINAVGSRSTKGVQVMKPKDGSLMIKVSRLENTKLAEPEYYRKSDSLNAVGFYLKPGDEV